MFVIAGIIILIVSFVVALISLIREQEHERVDEVVKPPVRPQQHPGHSEMASRPVFSQEPVSQVTSPAQPEPFTREFQPEQPIEPQTVQPAYPWEDGRKEKSIDEIRAELAKIAGEKSSGQKQEPSAPPVQESPMSPAPNNTWAPQPQPQSQHSSPQQGEVWVNPNR